MIHKDKRYRRMQRRNHIARKKNICLRTANGIPHYIDTKDIYRAPEIIEKCGIIGTCFFPWFFVEDEGRLDKGKIHCSCSLCSYCETPIDDKKNLMKMIDSVDYFLDDNWECATMFPNLPDITDDYNISNINREINKIKRTIKKNKPKKGWSSRNDKIKKTKDVNVGHDEFVSCITDDTYICKDIA